MGVERIDYQICINVFMHLAVQHAELQWCISKENAVHHLCSGVCLPLSQPKVRGGDPKKAGKIIRSRKTSYQKHSFQTGYRYTMNSIIFFCYRLSTDYLKKPILRIRKNSSPVNAACHFTEERSLATRYLLLFHLSAIKYGYTGK